MKQKIGQNAKPRNAVHTHTFLYCDFYNNCSDLSSIYTFTLIGEQQM